MPTEIDHYSIALIDNLEADIDEVALSGNLRIVRLDLLTDPRAEKLLGKETLSITREIQIQGPLSEGRYRTVLYRPSMMWPIVHRLAELSNHALEWRFVGEVADPFNTNYDRDTPINLFSDVITSLRLLKSGLVGRFTASHIIQGDPSGIEGPWSKGETLYYQPSPMNMFERYVLTKEDTSSLRQMFQVVSECKSKQMLIAIARFNRQYSRENDIDKLIDLVVGFESLYLRGITSELEFRLATRAATHLGREPSQRKKIYDCLSTAYRLRSEIIHGTTQELRGHKLLRKVSWDSPKAMLDQLSSMLREAISRILLSVGPRGFARDFHRQLDDALITGHDFL